VKRGDGFHIILIMFILFFISLSPAYFCYNQLAETNLFSGDLSFESCGQENLSIDQQSESKGSVTNVLSVPMLPGPNLFRLLFGSSSRALLIDQKPFALRC
jgi:hypothetical protein